jgi:hypothetical protein
MVNMGEEHSVVAQPVGLLSQNHATIIRTTGKWAHWPFLVSRQCILGSHEVRHEFLYLPNCSMGLMVRDLGKLRARITFGSDGTAALKLRGPEARVLTLMIAQEEEW